jgi:hyaluronate lyase
VSHVGTPRVRMSVHPVSNQSWDERTVTWNTKPAYGAMLGTVAVTGTRPQWIEIDVTGFVGAQKSAGRQTVSFTLRALERTSAYASFESKEAGAFAPQLVITR